MLIPHKGHTDTIQVYSVTVMTHVKALQAGHSSQGTSEPITPALIQDLTLNVQCTSGRYIMTGAISKPGAISSNYGNFTFGQLFVWIEANYEEI